MEWSEIVVLRKRTAVVRMEATNGDGLVGASLGTVSLQAPR